MSLLSPQLQAFLAVAEVGTVHGAAKKLGLTQTGVTQRLRALEAQLEVTFFIRSRKGMRLTDEGEALLRYCRSANAIEGATLSQLSQGKNSARNDVALTLIGPTSLMGTRIVQACTPLYAQYPHMRLHLMVDDHADGIQMLRNARADLAIVAPERVPNEMDSKKLKPERYILVASSKWKGRRLNDVIANERLIDFEADDTTSLNYLKHFSLINAATAVRERLFVNTNEALIKLFIAGVGFGTLTQEVAAPYLESQSLIALNSGQAVEVPQALVWYPRPHLPDYFEKLIHLVK